MCLITTLIVILMYIKAKVGQRKNRFGTKKVKNRNTKTELKESPTLGNHLKNSTFYLRADKSGMKTCRFHEKTPNTKPDLELQTHADVYG